MRAAFIALTLALCATDALAGSAALQRGGDGRWHAVGRVNGHKLNLVVDADAPMVTLTLDDARAAGVDVRGLAYDVPVRTAVGLAHGASVTLERLQIGDVRVRDVRAVVVQASLPESVLGQSFLDRLDTVQVRGQLLRLAR